MKDVVNHTLAVATKIVLKKVLQTDANAASCCMAWQGKVPEKLADFKTKKK